MDAILAHTEEPGSLPDMPIIHIMFDGTPEGSPLRSLVVDLVVDIGCHKLLRSKRDASQRVCFAVFTQISAQVSRWFLWELRGCLQPSNILRRRTRVRHFSTAGERRNGSVANLGVRSSIAKIYILLLR